jgi:uncharacterized protein YecT (DUF1311 family)
MSSMLRYPVSVALAICLAFVFRPAGAASFDCGKATTNVERAICADPALSKLDDDLQRIFHASRSSLADRDAPTLIAAQKNWIAERDRTCGGAVSDAAACLRKSYEDRIKAVRMFRLNSPYGVLRYHVVDGEEPDPVHVIGELFDQTFKVDGPLRSAIKCDTSTDDRFCPGLERPGAQNTVFIEYGSAGGAVGFGARYRSLLTDMDEGSGHFTNPVVALDFELDFEYSVERVRTPEGVPVSDIEVSLTGLAPLARKLPPLKGLPKAGPGCFGEPLGESKCS